jgi:hypothetical protein
MNDTARHKRAAESSKSPTLARHGGALEISPRPSELPRLPHIGGGGPTRRDGRKDAALALDWGHGGQRGMSTARHGQLATARQRQLRTLRASPRARRPAPPRRYGRQQQQQQQQLHGKELVTSKLDTYLNIRYIAGTLQPRRGRTGEYSCMTTAPPCAALRATDWAAVLGLPLAAAGVLSYPDPSDRTPSQPKRCHCPTPWSYRCALHSS